MNKRFSLIDVAGFVIAGLVLALVIVSVSLLLGSGSFDFNWYSPEGWEEESGVHEADGNFDSLKVSNIAGKIEVVGWSGNGVKVEYTKRAPTEKLLKKLEPKITESGNALLVERKAIGPGMQGSISFTIYIPKSIKNVRTTSVSGKISVRNTGDGVDQELKTVSGTIETQLANNLDASSTSGSIRFGFRGRILKINTISGSIEGKILYTEAGGNIDLSSVSGAVRLEAYSGLDAKLVLKSLSGSIHADPMPSDSVQTRGKLEGRYGAGSTKLQVNTASGSIRIKLTE